MAIGAAVREERRRRAWTIHEVARRARVSISTVSAVEAGRAVSLDAYARVSVALGLPLGVTIRVERRKHRRGGTDLVHAAMAGFEAQLLAPQGYRVAIDHPYQHYQFAGRADVLAWSLESAALLHSVGIRPATFRALGPDTEDRLRAWLQGDPPQSGTVRRFVALDLLARLRQRAFIGLDAVMSGARPRVFGYREAAARLRSAGRA